MWCYITPFTMSQQLKTNNSFLAQEKAHPKSSQFKKKKNPEKLSSHEIDKT